MHQTSVFPGRSRFTRLRSRRKLIILGLRYDVPLIRLKDCSSQLDTDDLDEAPAYKSFPVWGWYPVLGVGFTNTNSFDGFGSGVSRA